LREAVSHPAFGATELPSLAVLRRRRLLSQRALAQQAGIGTSTIYLIETGKVVPRLVTMQAICTALGLDDPLEVNEFRAAIERGEESEAREP
jgi:DNA-binding XRE family transcriptional regulator